MDADVRLIDFNYFFSGYLSDAYWSSWLVVTHDLTVGLFIVAQQIYDVDQVASGIFLHAQYPHCWIDRLCVPSWVGYAIYPPI